MALVADLFCEVVVDPFGFDLTEREAVMVRFEVEAAGRYHRTLMACLRCQGFEVVELNPGAVKEALSGQGRRRLKSDVRDLAAMAELLARGGGRPP